MNKQVLKIRDLGSRLTYVMPLVFAIISTCYPQSVLAWSETNTVNKTYSFKFRWKNQVLSIEKLAGSYDEAFGIAAQECYTSFKSYRKISYDEGVDIINSCANPRMN